MYIYPPLRKKLLPTIEETKKAIRLAESEIDPDPRPLLSILSRLPQADMRIAGLMQTRTLAVTGYPFDILPADSENAKAVEIAIKTKDRLIRSGLHHYFGPLLSSVFFGTSALKQEWQNIGKETIAKFSIIPCVELMSKNNTVVRIKDQDIIATEEMAPEEQFIVLRYNPFESVDPNYIGGLLRLALWLAHIKNFNWQDWGKFNELFAQPLRWAQWKRGASDEDKAVAKQAAEQIGTDAWAAVSEDVKLEFIEATRAGSIQAYKDLLHAVNDEMSILFLGQTLTTELAGNTGSKAAAQIHNLVRNDIMWSDLQTIERTVNEQYIAVDYKLNYGEDVTLRPSFRFNTDEVVDYEKNARIISEARAADIPLVRNEVYQKLGFNIPEEGDKII
jgi:phage gp29-like protein